MVSCFSLLDNFFKERNPILMRRKTFFICKQSSTQDKLAFMEDVRSAADEGDIAGMSVEDTICLVYVIGVKDDILRDKLSEVPDPNIEKFTAIMKSYVQSKIHEGKLLLQKQFQKILRLQGSRASSSLLLLLLRISCISNYLRKKRREGQDSRASVFVAAQQNTCSPIAQRVPESHAIFASNRATCLPYYLVRVAPDCNRSYCEDSFSGYSGSV